MRPSASAYFLRGVSEVVGTRLIMQFLRHDLTPTSSTAALCINGFLENEDDGEVENGNVLCLAESRNCFSFLIPIITAKLRR